MWVSCPTFEMLRCIKYTALGWLCFSCVGPHREAFSSTPGASLVPSLCICSLHGAGLPCASCRSYPLSVPLHGFSSIHFQERLTRLCLDSSPCTHFPSPLQFLNFKPLDTYPLPAPIPSAAHFSATVFL